MKHVEQLYAYSEIDRDQKLFRTISLFILHYCSQCRTIQNYHARRFSVANAPKLIFDHDNVKTCHKKIALQCPSNLLDWTLPEKFTMRTTVEYTKRFSSGKNYKRNFISKINSLDIDKKLEEKDIHVVQWFSLILLTKKIRWKPCWWWF
jgi:hypothetical protein